MEKRRNVSPVSYTHLDVYKRQVENSGGETFLFPAVPEFLDTLSPEQGVVTVRPIPGMFTNCLLYTSRCV